MWDCDIDSIPWNPYIVAWKYKGCTLKKVYIVAWKYKGCILKKGFHLRFKFWNSYKSLWINIYLILVTMKLVHATKISDLKKI